MVPRTTVVLAAQLDRLATLADPPNIDLVVVPAGAEPGPAQHDFALNLDQPEDQEPAVNVKLLHADMTIDDPDDVDCYPARMGPLPGRRSGRNGHPRLLRLT